MDDIMMAFHWGLRTFSGFFLVLTMFMKLRLSRLAVDPFIICSRITLFLSFEFNANLNCVYIVVGMSLKVAVDTILVSHTVIDTSNSQKADSKHPVETPSLDRSLILAESYDGVSQENVLGWRTTRKEKKTKENTSKERREKSNDEKRSIRVPRAVGLSKREQPLEQPDKAHNDPPHAVPADNDEPDPPHDAQHEPLEELEARAPHQAELPAAHAQDLVDSVVDLLDPQRLLRCQAHAESICFVGAVVHRVRQLVGHEGLEVCLAGVQAVTRVGLVGLSRLGEGLEGFVEVGGEDYGGSEVGFS